MSQQLLSRELRGCFEGDAEGIARVAPECPLLLWVVGRAEAGTLVLDAVFDATSVASSSSSSSSPSSAGAWRLRLEAGLPEGSSILGIFCRQVSDDSPPVLPEALLKGQKAPALIFGEATNGSLIAWRFDEPKDKLTPWRVDATAPFMMRTFARGRLRATLVAPTPSEAILQLEKLAANLEESALFVFPGSSMALSLKELRSEKQQWRSSARDRVVAIEVLSDSLGGLLCESPTNFLDQDVLPPVEYAFDFVTCIAPDSEAAVVAAALLAAARRQVLETAAVVAAHGGASALSAPHVTFRCFRLAQLQGQVLALRGVEEPGIRAALHKLLRLPQAPLLRPECALPWESEAYACSTGKPVNPHVGCGQRPGWWTCGAETKTAFIAGAYEYCHYMQDHFDDNGWGCAYRSLQTCVTWYRMQFYTSKPVPGILAMQELLKRIDDSHKDMKVGSRTWIGTIEGMYLLQDYLGVECRMLYCQDAADMASKVPQMLQHLEAHGSPIMVGAGQKAFTIVGLCYDGASGEVAFLVADPHYTGADELTSIVQKGWVGWKKLEFFEKSAGGGFINCCLPMVPRGPSNI